MNINEHLKTIRENLEAAEVDCYVSALTDALYEFVPLLDAVEAALEVLETEAEAAAKNRLAVDQRDPSMDSATVAMLSGVVLGRLQTTELIRRAITTALEGK